nr:hypothetical protein [Nocardia zapadnayensis]
MAIRDVQAFAHLTADDIESLGHELDRIRTDVEKSLGPRDAACIRRVITFQRALETASRLTLLCGARYRGTRIAGSVMPAGSKIIEMMSAHWKRAHNHIHHAYTNVYGMDADLGFVVMRMTRDEPWRPIHLLQRRGLRTALAATASKRGRAPGSGHRFQRWIGAFTAERGRQ